jgi:hypothetical protein
MTCQNDELPQNVMMVKIFASIHNHLNLKKKHLPKMAMIAKARLYGHVETMLSCSQLKHGVMIRIILLSDQEEAILKTVRLM